MIVINHVVAQHAIFSATVYPFYNEPGCPLAGDVVVEADRNQHRFDMHVHVTAVETPSDESVALLVAGLRIASNLGAKWLQPGQSAFDSPQITEEAE